ncbi:hypothetical protein [uncultured Litoreibacter sp.]|nr:hypothetical protein [uncultured Litoreibacter sp.]
MRKLIMLVLMGMAFYGGLKLERSISADRCETAGGIVNARGLCVGASE